MGRIYNVVLNSQLSNAAGLATPNEYFFYDWSQLPDTPYKITWTFNSANLVATNTTVANLYLDLGQGAYTSIASSNLATAGPLVGASYRANFIGTLEVRSYTNSTPASGSYLFASTNTNPPLYVDTRPRNNQLFVEIHTNGNTTETNYTPASGQYTLILSLESLK